MQNFIGETLLNYPNISNIANICQPSSISALLHFISLRSGLDDQRQIALYSPCCCCCCCLFRVTINLPSIYKGCTDIHDLVITRSKTEERWREYQASHRFVNASLQIQKIEPMFELWLATKRFTLTIPRNLHDCSFKLYWIALPGVELWGRRVKTKKPIVKEECPLRLVAIQPVQPSLPSTNTKFEDTIV